MRRSLGLHGVDSLVNEFSVGYFNLQSQIRLQLKTVTFQNLIAEAIQITSLNKRVSVLKEVYQMGSVHLEKIKEGRKAR